VNGHRFNPGDTRPTTPYYKEPNLSRIIAFTESIQPIAEAHDATIGQVVINWTIQQPCITSALVGARNRIQVSDNVKAIDFMLTKKEIAEINVKLENLKLEN